jgi:hypothetical protein
VVAGVSPSILKQTANAALAELADGAVLLPKNLGTTNSVTVWPVKPDIRKNSRYDTSHARNPDFIRCTLIIIE